MSQRPKSLTIAANPGAGAIGWGGHKVATQGRDWQQRRERYGVR